MISVKDLNVSYPDGTDAIKNISFDLQDGESVALVGANGAGKSTLLLSLVGVIKHKNGTISIDDLELSKKTLNDFRKRIGMVFQNTDDQLFMTSVMDDVAFGPRNYGIIETEVKKIVDETLVSLGIMNLKYRMPHKLSGGEKRSVALACVLAMKPSAILFDEPSSFLDPKARRKMMNSLRDLKCTKLIATHDLDMALEVCERTIVLKNGEICADGKTKDILINELFMDECGLELPLSYQHIK